MPKTYSQTYLYSQYSQYDKELFQFIMNATRIDVNSDAFGDVLFDVKRRQISNCLSKVLTSKNVVLCIGNKALPKAFKVFVANDVATDKNKRVFIDVTDCIVFKDGVYRCNNIEWIISYLITAMNSFIYTMQPNKVLSNQSIIKDGGEAFASLFSYIIDRIYKISTIQILRKRIIYISALYYQFNILEKDIKSSSALDSAKAIALKIAGLEPREAQLVDIQIKEDSFKDINVFLKTLSDIFNFKDLSISLVVDKWMQSFGTGTVFAMEYYPAFISMLTNTYVGGYIDQQLSIEKVTGQSMIAVTKTILQIGASIV